MRAVIQRVERASVSVDDEVVGAIGRGFLILVGVEESDTTEDMDWLINKIIKLRVFGDAEGLFNCALEDVQGGILVVSQFTLYGNLHKGSRPSFNRAASPALAEKLYDQFVERLRQAYARDKVAEGSFGAMMKVDLINDGPVTLWVDTKDKKY